MKFDYVPIEYHQYLPLESDHIDHSNIVRGAMISPNCAENFYPTCIENPDRIKKFMTQQKFDITLYSLSIYNSIENFEKDISKFPKTSAKILFYAIGTTSITYGISLKPDQFGHINYYLFDYLNLNPFGAFSLLNRGVTI